MLVQTPHLHVSASFTTLITRWLETLLAAWKTVNFLIAGRLPPRSAFHMERRRTSMPIVASSASVCCCAAGYICIWCWFRGHDLRSIDDQKGMNSCQVLVQNNSLTIHNHLKTTNELHKKELLLMLGMLYQLLNTQTDTVFEWRLQRRFKTISCGRVLFAFLAHSHVSMCVLWQSLFLSLWNSYGACLFFAEPLFDCKKIIFAHIEASLWILVLKERPMQTYVWCDPSLQHYIQTTPGSNDSDVLTYTLCAIQNMWCMAGSDGFWNAYMHAWWIPGSHVGQGRQHGACIHQRVIESTL